ncbi:hypothetical protein PI124_g21246 [Phytophthora idaei]|nr:hypothetical protein PI125_g20548 [Phytophthora idaei]KAG3129788.1 hypothetical protein PI126_g20803 [Phytophthora idaei]KAG3233684.1 hypothetical protein PI124_g21246 [Phytophthora idaei]
MVAAVSTAAQALSITTVTALAPASICGGVIDCEMDGNKSRGFEAQMCSRQNIYVRAD